MWQLLILSRYYRDFHPLIPIIDPLSSPNTIYNQSPFLFWMVVSLGSRKYARQPALTQALSAPVTQLALQSIVVRTKPIERVKALILMITWPFPSGPFYHDPSFLLTGALVHMGLQCGLHAPSSSSEFSKTFLKLPEQDPVRKAELWAYIVITYQRSVVLYYLVCFY